MDNQQEITKILLSLTALSGKMIGMATDPMKINGEAVVVVNAEWLHNTGLFLGNKALGISNLMFDKKIKEINAQTE